MRALRIIAFLAPGILANSLAQEALPNPTFRVTSERVVFDFIAVNKKTGEFVDDLAANELILKVDGKLQRVDLLFPPGGDPSTIDPRKLPHARHAATATPRTVILLDSRSLDAGNFHRSVRAMQRFIRQAALANHLVMLAEIDRTLRTVTPFTRDQQALLDAAASLTPAIGTNPWQRSRILNNPLADKNFLDEIQQQVTHLRSGLSALCYSLSGTPGRKHVVVFSQGYPIDPVQDIEFERRDNAAFQRSSTARQASSRAAGASRDPGVLPMVRDIVGLANSFGIHFYTVDARGLAALPGLAAEVSGSATDPPGPRFGVLEKLDPSGLTTFNLSTFDTLESSRNTLVALAGGTNGSAFFNSNDLTPVLRAAVGELGKAYLASFVPRKLKGGRDFRRLKLRTTRKDVVIRSQVGYRDVPAKRLASERFAAAFQNPQMFTHLAPVVAVKPSGAKTRVEFGLPGSQVASLPLGEKVHIDLAFLGRVYDGEGKPLSDEFEIARAFSAELEPGRFQSLTRQNIMGSSELGLKSGAYKLVLVAEDRVGGALGAKAVDFRVP